MCDVSGLLLCLPPSRRVTGRQVISETRFQHHDTRHEGSVLGAWVLWGPCWAPWLLPPQQGAAANRIVKCRRRKQGGRGDLGGPRAARPEALLMYGVCGRQVCCPQGGAAAARVPHRSARRRPRPTRVGPPHTTATALHALHPAGLPAAPTAPWRVPPRRRVGLPLQLFGLAWPAMIGWLLAGVALLCLLCRCLERQQHQLRQGDKLWSERDLPRSLAARGAACG